jgi:hypothetical protein
MSVIPGLSMLTKIWIIYSTSFKPDKTLSCYCCSMVGHFIPIFLSIIINVVFVIMIFSPFDPDGKTLEEIAYNAMMKALSWLAVITLITAILEISTIIGYIMYFKRLRADNSVSSVI